MCNYICEFIEHTLACAAKSFNEMFTLHSLICTKWEQEFVCVELLCFQANSTLIIT